MILEFVDNLPPFGWFARLSCYFDVNHGSLSNRAVVGVLAPSSEELINHDRRLYFPQT